MKRNLLKAIGISFLIFVILSWIIPVGTYYSGELTKNGIDAVGLFDLIYVPVNTLITFALYAVVFMAIGGLYGVMEKTGALDTWVNKISKKFTGKEKGFVVFTIIFFVILSSVTGLILPLFVLVPLFAMVLTKLNYDKVSAMASTVGALLLGSVCSTYGFNITGYTKNILSLDMNSEIVAKIILLVLLTALLIIFVLKFSKKVEPVKVVEEAVKEEPVKEVKKTNAKKASTKTTSTKKTTKSSAKKTTAKKSTKKTTKNMAVAKDVKKVKAQKTVSIIPLVVIIVLMMLVTFLGMYNWYYSFEISIFDDWHTAVMGIEIGDFAIFENLLSGIDEFGYWGNTEFIMMMVIASMLLAFIYRLSINDYVESFIAGVKKMMPTAIYAALASVILTVLYQALYSGTGTIVETMFATIFGMADDFNVIVTAIASLVGSFFYNDLYYLLSSLSSFLTEFDESSLSIAGLVAQSVYGIGMLIFPTSVILIAGLSYFDVSWKQWFKYIWKFALAIFIVVIIVCLILTAL